MAKRRRKPSDLPFPTSFDNPLDLYATQVLIDELTKRKDIAVFIFVTKDNLSRRKVHVEGTRSLSIPDSIALLEEAIDVVRVNPLR